MIANIIKHSANIISRRQYILITIETEGSHFLPTDHPIGLISLRPKFSNSVTIIGAVTPGGYVVDERFISTHNRHMLYI